ncbi:MAG TPA: hypothetical protein VLF71_04925 [Candidatus Saccharimonadales bacterium]|nr:hypothetical protein [Candidatus Saccharimonadales bacterium]
MAHGNGGNGHNRHPILNPDGSLPTTIEERTHQHTMSRRFNVAAVVIAATCATLVGAGVWTAVDRVKTGHAATSHWDPSGINSAPSRAGQIDPGNHHVSLGLANSTDPGLRKLAALEKQYSYAPNANAMHAEMPANPADAEAKAAAMVTRLQEYSKQGIEPFVFFGSGRDARSKKLPKVEGGAYQDTLNAYFTYIKRAGITDQQMGAWMLLPDANDTSQKGGAVSPADYQSRVVPAAQAIKTHWDAKVGLMFDGSDPMQAYVEGIPRGLVDVLGVQALPSSASDPVSHYLPVKGIATAAKTVGANIVWVDTGTFSKAHDAHGHPVTETAEDRSRQLATTVMGAAALKGDGLLVSAQVEMFNNYPQGGADWSYGPADYQSVIAGIGMASGQGVPFMFGVGE